MCMARGYIEPGKEERGAPKMLHRSAPTQTRDIGVSKSPPDASQMPGQGPITPRVVPRRPNHDENRKEVQTGPPSPGQKGLAEL